MAELAESIRRLRERVVKVDVIDILILRCIGSARRRYIEIDACVYEHGVNLRNALANRLLKLRERGLVARDGDAYVLTDDGRELLRIVRALTA